MYAVQCMMKQSVLKYIHSDTQKSDKKFLSCGFFSVMYEFCTLLTHSHTHTSSLIMAAATCFSVSFFLLFCNRYYSFLLCLHLFTTANVRTLFLFGFSFVFFSFLAYITWCRYMVRLAIGSMRMSIVDMS